MLNVNLLPESYRKPKISPVRQFHRSPLFLLIAVVLVAIIVVLAGIWQVNQVRLVQLNGRLQQLAAQKQTVEELRQSLQTLRGQDAVFQRLSSQRRQWAKVLNAFSDLVPDNVWFTDLSLDQQNLVVQGSAVAQSGEEMVKIGQFVQGLKASPEIASLIQDIQIESIKSVQQKEVEIVEFTLTCKFGTNR